MSSAKSSFSISQSVSEALALSNIYIPQPLLLLTNTAPLDCCRSTSALLSICRVAPPNSIINNASAIIHSHLKPTMGSISSQLQARSRVFEHEKRVFEIVLSSKLRKIQKCFVEKNSQDAIAGCAFAGDWEG